jgi:hypothetical protein
VSGQSDFGGPGVHGTALSTGINAYGVWGTADPKGDVGVYGASKHGLALKAQGNSVFNGTTNFSRSGMLTIASGIASATIGNVSLSSASLVLATIQGNVPGVWVEGVTTVPGSRGSFTIYLNRTAPTNLIVGWFIVN